MISKYSATSTSQISIDQDGYQPQTTAMAELAPIGGISVDYQ
jgi:hypothetical protein